MHPVSRRDRRARMNSSEARRASLLTGLALLLIGCDNGFDPFAPTELTFAIYGRLEAAADTQWLRVRPLQTSPEIIENGLVDAVVTIEEIETGATTQMQDSVFRFQSYLDHNIGISVSNFWSTMPIVPGRHYRVTATRSDGAYSTATVRIPVITDPRVTVVHYRNPLLNPPVAFIRGLEHVAMAYGDTHVRNCDYFVSIYREVYIAEPYEGGVRVTLADQAPGPFRMIPPSCSPAGDKRAHVVTSEEDWGWPFDTSIRLEDLMLVADSRGNVDLGVGFVGGTHQLEFPVEPCSIPDGMLSCEQVYHGGPDGGLKWNPGLQ